MCMNAYPVCATETMPGNAGIDHPSDGSDAWKIEQGSDWPESGQVPGEGSEGIEALKRIFRSLAQKTDVHGTVQRFQGDVRDNFLSHLFIAEIDWQEMMKPIQPLQQCHTALAQATGAVVQDCNSHEENRIHLPFVPYFFRVSSFLFLRLQQKNLPADELIRPPVDKR